MDQVRQVDYEPIIKQNLTRMNTSKSVHVGLHVYYRLALKIVHDVSNAFINVVLQLSKLQ